MTALARGVWLAFLVPLLAGFLFAQSARAQAGPDLTVRPTAAEVEVDEPFQIELKALVDQGQTIPSDPELRPPRELKVQGPQVSQQTFAQFGGGINSVRVGLGAVWQLSAPTPGRYVIPGPTVKWNGKQYRGAQVTIEVKPSSGRPRRQSSNPFLMPGGPGLNIPWPFGGRAIDEDEQSDVADLALMIAPDPNVFLRAMVDKTNVVVGEQVTLSLYMYLRGDLSIVDWHEAPLNDFLRVPLIKNPGTEPFQSAIAGGNRYRVRLFDKVAIFPMRAGDLHTGSMRITFAGRRIGGQSLRVSEDQVIHVTEPPRDLRPAGYVPGHVGQFSITAAVQPKRVDQGGAVSVSIKVAGTGNLPQALSVPERVGVEWLEPEKKDAIEPMGNIVSGWRTFGYVVRLKNSGAVDLGEIAFPYWNPAARRYEVARATLGTVDVNPTSPAADSSARAEAPKTDPFAALAGPRAKLGEYRPKSAPLFGGRSLWLLIAAPPLLVGLFSASAGAVRRARARRASNRESPAALAAKALDDAAAAEKAGDKKALTAAVERAIHLAIEGAIGLKSRGILRADLAGELERRGVDRELAERIDEALGACETIRFEPAALAGEDDAAHELAAEARAIVDDLSHVKAP